MAREYAVQRWDPPDARSWVAEVRLILEDDGRFELQVHTHYSDWGERSRRGRTYRGTFAEHADAILAHAARVRLLDVRYDHDGLGDYVKNERRTEPSRETFRFEKRGAALVNPVVHDRHEGALLREGVDRPRTPLPAW